MKIIRIPKFRRNLFDQKRNAETFDDGLNNGFQNPLTGFTKYQISKMTGLSVKRLNELGLFQQLEMVSDPDDPAVLFAPKASVEVIQSVLRFRGLTKILGRRPAQSIKMARYLSRRFDAICPCGSFSISRGLQRWCPKCGKSEISILSLLPPLPDDGFSSSPFSGFAVRKRPEIMDLLLT